MGEIHLIACGEGCPGADPSPTLFDWFWVAGFYGTLFVILVGLIVLSIVLGVKILKKIRSTKHS